MCPRPRRRTSQPAGSGLTHSPANWPAFRYVPAPGTRRTGHRAGATVPGNNVTRRNGGCDAVTGSASGVGMTERPALRFSLRCESGRWPCCRDRTQHTLSVWSLVPRSHLNSFRADNSPRVGPFSAELRSDNVALCAIPRPHCHGDCFPPSPAALRLPAWWQSPRQFDGIRHANPVAPP